MHSTSLLAALVLLAVSLSSVQAHGVFVAVNGATNGNVGSAFGEVASTPRDGTKRTPFQTDSSIIRDKEIASGDASACGRTLAGGVNDIQAQMLVAESAGLPDVGADGQVSMTLHQVNGDGAGPYTCDVSMDATGKNFVAMKVTTNVPGKNSRSQAKATDFPVLASMPAGAKCTGGADGQTCLVRCRNAARAGPFGGCMAVTQAAAAENSKDAAVKVAADDANSKDLSPKEAAAQAASDAANSKDLSPKEAAAQAALDDANSKDLSPKEAAAQAAIDDANSKDLSPKEAAAQAALDDANSKDLSPKEAAAQAALDDANSKDLSPKEAAAQAALDDANSKDLSPKEAAAQAALEDANSKDLTPKEAAAQAALDDANSKDLSPKEAAAQAALDDANSKDLSPKEVAAQAALDDANSKDLSPKEAAAQAALDDANSKDLSPKEAAAEAALDDANSKDATAKTSVFPDLTPAEQAAADLADSEEERRMRYRPRSSTVV